MDHTYLSPAGKTFPSRVKVVQHLGLASDPGSKGGRRLTDEEREERPGAKQLKEKQKGIEKGAEKRTVTGDAKEAVPPVPPPTAPLPPGGGGGHRSDDEPVAAAAVATLLVPGGGGGRAHSASLRALLESVIPAGPATVADDAEDDDDDDDGEEEAAVAERAHTALCGTLAGSLRQLGFAPAHSVLELLWRRAAPRTAAAATAHEVGALAALRGACSAPAAEGSEEGGAAVALRQLLRRFPPADSATAAATTVAVDVAAAARADDSTLALLRCVNHALAATGASAALALAADSALLRAAADALSSPHGGSGAAELLDVLHGAVTVCGAAASHASHTSNASPPPPSPSSTGAVADGATPPTLPTPPTPPPHTSPTCIYEAVSAAFGAARGEAQARLLTAVQGRALEAGWLLLELRLRLPPPSKAAATAAAALAADDDADAAEADGLSFGPVCALLRPPPSHDARGGLLLRLQACLARCALARCAWPAADAAALAVLCGRLHRLAEKRGAAAVAAGLALAEASWQRQAAAAALAATTPAAPHKALEQAPHEKENVGPPASSALF